ncbi:MAG TPA: ferrochelatase [Pyrinomonadaceae bacterium]|nr:ferrochelatase [Pyrinomonadaceae bacterium]
MKDNFDALLIVSFGGPEGMDDVMPFLENVVRGRNVPRERLLGVAHHYQMFGGVSPINQQNRNLIAALAQELQKNGPQLPIYWGNRNWHPFLADALREMATDGIKNARAFVTSAYSSFSSCRQYQQNIAAAQSEVGPSAPRVEKLRAFYNHPLFIEANVDRIVRTGFKMLEAGAHLVFTAHSIPESMATKSDYAAQLEETARLIAAELRHDNWNVVYQSRSGSPSQPWLGPDICDYVKELKAKGVTDVVVAPIGFVSDHMEVVYDLDVELRRLVDELGGMNLVRAATAGTHPSFVKMIRELILERVDNAPARFLGSRGVPHFICPADCCLPG